jgi:predicted RNA binding protein YcfA (HicA-like mRNA interferase family)
MSEWLAAKAGTVPRGLYRIGWTLKRHKASHRTLGTGGVGRTTFHYGEEIWPRMLARIAKHTGLRPEDL